MMRAKRGRIKMMRAKKMRSTPRSIQMIIGTSRIMIIIVILVFQGFLNGLIHGARYLGRG